MRVLMYFKVSFDNDAFFFEVELLNYKITLNWVCKGLTFDVAIP